MTLFEGIIIGLVAWFGLCVLIAGANNPDGFNFLNRRHNTVLNTFGVVILNILLLPGCLMYWFWKLITWRKN